MASINVMTGRRLCNRHETRAFRQFMAANLNRWIGCLSKLPAAKPIYQGENSSYRKAWFAMRNSYLKHLRAQREELEAKLELHRARYCFGDGEVDDGTEAELRQRITEISEEIAGLESQWGE